MNNEIIILHKYDEINFKVDASSSQLMELKEYLSCYIKNHKFHPKVKARVWDGKVSYFNILTRFLPIGMLSLFIDFCELYNYDYDFSFDINKYYNTHITEDEIDSYLDDLFSLSDKKPRYFQREAIFKAITEKRGLLLSATGCLDPKSKILCNISKEDYEFLKSNFCQ